ncbi:hypothetical protein AM586_09915 [Massilia sp. WG5]|nr:hypothetical protein AM586_09915 [Massilia sp. WG5]
MLVLALAAQPLLPALADDPGWPRELTAERAKLVFYEPQVDAWKNYRELDFRLAFELSPANGKPAVGIGEIHARTDVDVDKRQAVIRDLRVTETRFPSAPPDEQRRLDALFRKFVTNRGDIPISLDRLVALADKPQAAPRGVAVRNDPPTIFVSYQPSMLLQTDGKPVSAATGRGGVEFIVNANWPVLRAPGENRYYLFNDATWLSGARLEGPWTPAGPLPGAISRVLDDPQWADLKKAAASSAGARKAPSTPAVFFSSTPAEVIVFDGKPVYAPIPGTELVYAKNTDADLFVDQRSKSYYFLAAGRWFRAASLDGPWTFASAELPPDFARIPPDSPASRVLVSVPGTEAAKDAVLLAQVPTRVTLDPKQAAAMVDVSYDGQPEFKPIEGTQLSYAVNTPDRVIKVDRQYYLCENGVWFYSSAPTGPWTTAPSVPSQIYTIPPSSPVYNVTYVTQTTAPNGYVDASYTAGYFGTFVMGMAVGAIIADGSGYWYPPYYHYPAYGGYPVYRPYAATYGVGSFYNPYTGAYGASRGVYGPYRGTTGSASYNPYTGTYARAGSAYGPYGSRAAAGAYNPYTRASARAGAVAGPGGSAAFAGGRNPATGNAAATRQASSVYGSWGSSVVQRGGVTTATRHATTASGSVGAARSSTGAGVVAGTGARGSGGVARSAGGDLYAGRDGNVYRRSEGSWQRYDNGGWSNTAAQPRESARSSAAAQARATARPAAQTSSLPQNLNRDFQDRQRGAMQSQRFSNFSSSGSPGGRGSGFGGRGGGGRRGR